MQQHRNWLRPNLAEMHTTPAADLASAPSNDLAEAAFAASRQRVALGEAVPLGALDGGGPAPVVSVREREAVWPAAVALDRAPAPDAEVLMSTLSCVTDVRVARSMVRKSERVGCSGPQARWREFEFVGQGSLSVISSISGRHYRFLGYGARVAVDSRDWGQLSRVPSLRLVVD